MSRYNYCGLVIVGVILSGCTLDVEPGSFADDVDFLRQHYANTLVLSDGESLAAVTPELQGRLMTSTAEGSAGDSYGWLNYDLIASGKIEEHFNPVGGEERFWLGPEGGQFSIYFKPGTSFQFENWTVPAEIDTQPFTLVEQSESSATFSKSMELMNYSGQTFELDVERAIQLVDSNEAALELGIASIPENVKMVGIESRNTITNTGDSNWDKSSGMLSIWILSMLKSSDEATVIVPFKKGTEEDLGPIVVDDYFGKVPTDRLIIADGVMFFRADGRMRSKIGVSPKRALPVVGSYDAAKQLLTIAQFSVPENNDDYVNSLWQLQEFPFGGDVVNSYNDGPLDDGSQLGPFYELESSSPAAALNPKQSLLHIHRTFHFKGDPESLDGLVKQLLGTDLAAVNRAF
jgi:hypothetical protein